MISLDYGSTYLAVSYSLTISRAKRDREERVYRCVTLLEFYRELTKLLRKKIIFFLSK